MAKDGVEAHLQELLAANPSVIEEGLLLVRREHALADDHDLYVHPRTVVLPSFAAGWVRDLEGQTTNDLSNSDVAFHTLREYSPGDDPRYLDWRLYARSDRYYVKKWDADTNLANGL